MQRPVEWSIWKQRMRKQGTVFALFLAGWADHLVSLNLPAHQVQKVVGYPILLKALLFSLAKQASRGEGLTTAMLRACLAFIRLDPVTTSSQVKILFLRTNMYVPEQVALHISYAAKFMEACSQRMMVLDERRTVSLPPSFDWSFVLLAISKLLESAKGPPFLATNVYDALWLCRRLMTPDAKTKTDLLSCAPHAHQEKLLKMLLEDNFDAILCHWANFVRDGFVKLLLYSVQGTSEDTVWAGRARELLHGSICRFMVETPSPGQLLTEHGRSIFRAFSVSERVKYCCYEYNARGECACPEGSTLLSHECIICTEDHAACQEKKCAAVFRAGLLASVGQSRSFLGLRAPGQKQVPVAMDAEDLRAKVMTALEASRAASNAAGQKDAIKDAPASSVPEMQIARRVSEPNVKNPRSLKRANSFSGSSSTTRDVSETKPTVVRFKVPGDWNEESKQLLGPYVPHAERKLNDGLRGFVFWEQLTDARKASVIPTMALSHGGAHLDAEVEGTLDETLHAASSQTTSVRW
jgi:hypothetical protein